MRGTGFFLLLAALPLLAAEIRSGTGEWKPGGRAKELFSTPLGAVYSLVPGDDDGIFFTGWQLHSNSCKCKDCLKASQKLPSALELVLPRKMRITAKTRFLVLDFRIRAFPALEKNSSSRLIFSVINAGRQIAGSAFTEHSSNLVISDDLKGVYHDTPTWTSEQSKKGTIQEGSPHHHPAFEPMAVRVIYDLGNNSVVYYLNGPLNSRRVRGKNRKKQISGRFGLAVFDLPKQRKKHRLFRERRTQYFEVSPPTVQLADDESRIPAVPEFVPYPYGKYPAAKDKRNSSSALRDAPVFGTVLRDKNPDLQYAMALRYLYGNDSEFDSVKSLKLLKQAAEKHHVRALYQLGVCYWRGYGMEPDRKTAEKYLLRAQQLGFTDADSLLFQMDREQSGYPWFHAQKYPDTSRIISQAHTPAFQQLHKLTDMPNPKILRSGLPIFRIAARPPQIAESYLDYCVRQPEPLSWLVNAVTLHRDGDRHWIKGEPYIRKALSANQPDAFPFLLLRMVHQNKLPDPAKIKTDLLLSFADHPLFNLLYTVMKLPPSRQTGYLQDIINSRFSEDNPRDPESKYLYACRKLYRKDPFCHPLTRKTANMDKLKNNPSANKENRNDAMIFSLMLSAADQNYAPAQYFIGRCYWFDDIPRIIEPFSADNAIRKDRALRYLRPAAQKGHAGARLLLSKIEMESALPDYRLVLGLLEPFCRDRYPEALYLKALALYRSGKPVEAESAAEAAAKSGCHRGWQLLAGLKAKQDKTAECRQYRQRFIQADLEVRKNDINDFHWPDPYREYLKWGPQIPAEKYDAVQKRNQFSDLPSAPDPDAGSKGKKSRKKSKIRFRNN